MPAKTDTPAMRQFKSFKDQQPDCLLLFRMGDFYELFFEDAVKASEAIGLTLTQRSEGVPMAGVPHHQLENYLTKLVDRGFRVAVADQTQDPKEAKGVVDRAITQIVTPGTLTHDALLEQHAPNRVAAVLLDDPDLPDARAALAVVELSAGSFEVLTCPAAGLLDELAARAVSELIYPELADAAPPPTLRPILARAAGPGPAPTPRPAWHFRPQESHEALARQYRVASLQGFGLQDQSPEARAAGALVRYLRETQAVADDHPAALAHLQPPTRAADTAHCTLDAFSLRALEVERTIRTGAVQGSLVGLFLGPPAAGGCRTPMGKRLVRDWLCRPLAAAPEITRRHARVAALTGNPARRDALAAALAGVQDIPRITARVALNRASPRDLVALGRSVERLAPVAEAVQDDPAFAEDTAQITSLQQPLAALATRIRNTLSDEPPARLTDGNVVRDGVDEELDHARSLLRDGSKWLAAYQAKITAQLDLPDAKAKVKVGYNSVFGYYIELTAVQARDAAERLAACEMTRKQTLKNAERFITPELKAYEDDAARAEGTALDRERAVFTALLAETSNHLRHLDHAQRLLAEIDVLTAFATRAARRDWTRPEINDRNQLSITAGRHPVLEELLEGEFTPNSVDLGPTPGTAPDRAPDPADPPTQDARPNLALITGPNMAGKSTYIRQVALITLLAHAGSFVPAEAATIGLCDRIFTRVGADDALHEGQSTFMVEMTETANILNNATPRSLIVLDEIGRGTSTLDGLSLAWAIAESLAAARPRTLFATHYHELTVLEQQLRQRVQNLHVRVREHNGDIVFLHQIHPGRAEASYGVQVARLAGLPAPVVERAADILDNLRLSHHTLEDAGERIAETANRAANNNDNNNGSPATGSQLGLFTEFLPHPALEEIKALDLNTLSPLEAFDALRSISDTVTRPHQASADGGPEIAEDGSTI
ncbi:MAG: DNA mismatch repair protein MutS [Planctomycetota bacterium]